MKNNLLFWTAAFPLGLSLLAGCSDKAPRGGTTGQPTTGGSVPSDSAKTTPHAVAVPVVPPPPPPPPPPIIAHWSFDGDPDTVISDSGPYGLHGTVTGETPGKIGRETGRVGQALRLDAGHRLRIEIGTAPQLNLKPPFTVAAWIKRRGTNPSSMEIFCYGDDVEKAGWRLRYGWQAIYFTYGDGEKICTFESPRFSVPDDKWCHVAVTHDGKVVRIFLNGEPVTAQAAPTAPADFKRSAVIGNYTGRPDAYNFVGLIDEMVLIGKALDKEEIFRLAAP